MLELQRHERRFRFIVALLFACAAYAVICRRMQTLREFHLTFMFNKMQGGLYLRLFQLIANKMPASWCRVLASDGEDHVVVAVFSCFSVRLFHHPGCVRCTEPALAALPQRCPVPFSLQSPKDLQSSAAKRSIISFKREATQARQWKQWSRNVRGAGRPSM